LANNVEVFFQDEERASGVVIGVERERIPWTAVRGARDAWYVVLHGAIAPSAAFELKTVLASIQDQLRLARAA
jgi:hypothetical protein